MKPMNKEYRFHYTDSLLKTDAEHWCSPSYGGMSSRSELWMTSIGFFLLQLPLTCWLLKNQPLILNSLFCLFFVICFLPLLVRRARQMGAVWYGFFMVALGGLMVVDSLLIGFGYGALLLIWVAVGPFLFPLALLPLYFIGGTYSGAKNALMRAAMEGDREWVEHYIRQYPSGLRQKSEKGFTASAYARLSGHHELADFLEAEAAAQEKKTAAQKQPPPAKE